MAASYTFNGVERWLDAQLNCTGYSTTFTPAEAGTYTIWLGARSYEETNPLTGQGSKTVEITVKAKTPGTPSPYPVSVTANGFTIGWNAVSNATGYETKLGDGSWVSTTETTKSYPGNPNTTYTVYVRALNGTEPGSAGSAVVTPRPETTPEPTPEPHKHNFSIYGYEADHSIDGHKEYNKCDSCGDHQYTGTYCPESWHTGTPSSNHADGHIRTDVCTVTTNCGKTRMVPYSGMYPGCQTCNPPTTTPTLNYASKTLIPKENFTLEVLNYNGSVSWAVESATINDYTVKANGKKYTVTAGNTAGTIVVKATVVLHPANN